MHTKRIARGARWLDKKDPDWFERIRISYLNPYSGNHCVLGQVFGDFERVIRRRYFLPEWDSMWTLIYPGSWFALWFIGRNGFAIIGETTSQWHDAWREEINKRIDTKKKSQLYVPAEWEAATSKSRDLSRA